MNTKISKLFFSLCVLIMMTACTDYNITTPDDFKVLTEKTYYSNNDSVVFHFEGMPDNIIFYSGEVGRNYDNRYKFSSEEGETTFEFISNVRNPLVPNNLSVLISTDFSGVYDSINIKNALWTDITERVTLPINNIDVPSGNININDFNIAGRSVYIAFRYLSDRPETLLQNYWNIGNFKLKTTFEDQTSFIHANSNQDAAFGIVDLASPDQKWNNGSRLIHLGLQAGNPHDDDWAITKGFDLSKKDGDVRGSVMVKDIQMPRPSSFSWRYNNPGTYKAVFIAQNSTINGIKEIVREIEIIIE